jgi:hypothetical protein
MRTDPTDNGGLFLGRRPGTAPIRYRALPKRGTPMRRTIDRAASIFVLLVMVLVCLTFWGPLPAAWLWVGGQVQGQVDNIAASILTTFFGLMASYLVGLIILKRLDHLWVLIRRAAGVDQRSGVVVELFALCAVLGVIGFSIWFLFINGPGSSIGPAHPQ